MKQYEIRLSEETAVFYERIASQAGRDVEQVLSDALFKLAVSCPWRRSIKRDKKEGPTRPHRAFLHMRQSCQKNS